METGSIYKTPEGREALMGFYDTAIAYWTFPHDSALIPTRFGDTHCITAGSRENPALILLHGSASNILGWGGAIPEYMRDFHVIAPDIPGEAGRGSPVRPSWENDDYVLWLDDLLDGLKINHASLLGLSLGGWIAAKYAAHRPERTERLVLLAPGGITPARMSTVLKTVLYSMQKEKGAEKMKRLIFGDGAVLPQVSMFFDLLQKHFQPRFGSPKLLTDAELGAISCPVLMQASGEDAFFDAPRTAKRLKKLLPKAEILIEENASHGITEYGGRLAAFLSGKASA